MNPPSHITYRGIDEFTIEVTWLPVSGARRYEVMVAGENRLITTEDSKTTITGLFPLTPTDISVRAVGEDGVISAWVVVHARTSYGIPIGTVGYYGVLGPVVGERTIFTGEMTAADGTARNVTAYIWWQESDGGWWGSLESPTNTKIVSSRRLGLNCGLLDNIPGAFEGNIVMRSTAFAGTDEPDRHSFDNFTHELRLEPS